MIRCEGNFLYTGITTDIERRFNEHSEKDVKGAKYTKSHTVEKIEAVWRANTRSDASKLEYNLKKLPKAKKEEIILDNDKLNQYLSEKIDCKLFVRHK
jgi:putative endonuclease